MPPLQPVPTWAPLVDAKGVVSAVWLNFFNSLRVTATAELIATDLSDVAYGTWTPTLTNVTNVSASTAYSGQYVRIGALVHCSGRLDVDPTAAGAAEVGISLPVASDFANANECAGTAASPGVAGQVMAIHADATNNRAAVLWVAVNTANQATYFSFTYRIL